MNILVTPGAGYIDSQTCVALLETNRYTCNKPIVFKV